MNLTKCDGVKLENNGKNFNIVKELVKLKIPVMGHIGYTPQFKKKFKVEGRTIREIKKLLKDAILIEKAFSIRIASFRSFFISLIVLPSTLNFFLN